MKKDILKSRDLLLERSTSAKMTTAKDNSIKVHYMTFRFLNTKTFVLSLRDSHVSAPILDLHKEESSYRYVILWKNREDSKDHVSRRADSKSLDSTIWRHCTPQNVPLTTSDKQQSHPIGKEALVCPLHVRTRRSPSCTRVFARFDEMQPVHASSGRQRPFIGRLLITLIPRNFLKLLAACSQRSRRLMRSMIPTIDRPGCDLRPRNFVHRLLCA